MFISNFDQFCFYNREKFLSSTAFRRRITYLVKNKDSCVYYWQYRNIEISPDSDRENPDEKNSDEGNSNEAN